MAAAAGATVSGSVRKRDAPASTSDVVSAPKRFAYEWDSDDDTEMDAPRHIPWNPMMGTVALFISSFTLDPLATLRGVSSDSISLFGDGVTPAIVSALPTGLRSLRIVSSRLTEETSFAHLTSLEHLNISDTDVGDATIASLPPSVRELNVSGCRKLSTSVSFAHLPEVASGRGHLCGRHCHVGHTDPAPVVDTVMEDTCPAVVDTYMAGTDPDDDADMSCMIRLIPT